MKFRGFDGRQYSVTLTADKRGKVSQYHQRARNLLKLLYPFDLVFEEIFLPGSGTKLNKQLYVDFFIPSQNLMIEVHGDQHYKFNSHFYENKIDFLRAKARDQTKRDYAETNGFSLVELPYNESDEQWSVRIKERNNVSNS